MHRHAIQVIATLATVAVGHEIEPLAVGAEHRVELVGCGVEGQRSRVLPATVDQAGLPQVAAPRAAVAAAAAPDDPLAVRTDTGAHFIGLARDYVHAFDAVLGQPGARTTGDPGH